MQLIILFVHAFISYSAHIGHHKYDCNLEYSLAASEIEVTHAKPHDLLCIRIWFPKLEKDTNLVRQYQSKALNR